MNIKTKVERLEKRLEGKGEKRLAFLREDGRYLCEGRVLTKEELASMDNVVVFRVTRGESLADYIQKIEKERGLR